MKEEGIMIEKIKENKEDILILLTLTFCLLLSTCIALNAFDLNEIIDNKSVVILILCAIVLFIKKFKLKELNVNEKKRIKLFIILWGIFIISITCSKIIHKEINLIDDLILFFVVPIFFFINNSYNTNKHLALAAIMNVIPVLVIMKEVNTIGVILAFAGVLAINLAYDKLRQRNMILTYVMIAVVFAGLIILTKSRTALLAFLFVAFINFILLIIQSNNRKQAIKKTIIIIIVVLLLAPFIIPNLYKLIFEKYSESSTNMTSGRTKMWNIVFHEKVGAFGLGNEQLVEKINKGDTHNMFVQMLGHYGVIPFIIYILLNIYIIYRAIKVKNKNAINILIIYYIIGMFENILIPDTRLAMCNIVLFYCIGNILSDNNNVKEQEIEMKNDK